jgi:hypothetical protein
MEWERRAEAHFHQPNKRFSSHHFRTALKKKEKGGRKKKKGRPPSKRKHHGYVLNVKATFPSVKEKRV